ncbi:hypothetical protein [Sinomonas sp. ASV322]|uniref:hypothetical protein n=1 Tax=Sinomonas sp. ASV322 TaxID=3041920 RepID=UPI0027DCFCCF|nr:hypothetical protein [Sinomonas sp. ASV322]MDQ4504561.1 hypothetical protein [Sinomonas sp. ASV322]
MSGRRSGPRARVRPDRPARVIPLGELKGDVLAGAAAYAAAGLGAAGVASLAAMYAVEVPRGGPFVFGAINDFVGGMFYVAALPAIIQIHRRLDGGPWSRAGLAAVAAASGAAGASGVLLSLQVVPIAPSTAVSIGGIVAQAGWAAVVNHHLLHRTGYPRRLALSGRAIGVGMLAALPLATAGYALPGAPALQRILYACAGTIGIAAYIGWPIWLFATGRRLRTPLRIMNEPGMGRVNSSGRSRRPSFATRRTSQRGDSC